MRDALYKSKITRVEKFGRGSARFRNTKSTKAISFFFLKVKLHIKILHKSKVTMTRLKNLGEKFRLDFETQNQHYFPPCESLHETNRHFLLSVFFKSEIARRDAGLKQGRDAEG